MRSYFNDSQSQLEDKLKKAELEILNQKFREHFKELVPGTNLYKDIVTQNLRDRFFKVLQPIRNDCLKSVFFTAATSSNIGVIASYKKSLEKNWDQLKGFLPEFADEEAEKTEEDNWRPSFPVSKLGKY